MDKDGILKIVDTEGYEKEYSVLFTFDSNETNKSYVIYTDFSRSDNGNMRVFTSSYDKTDETGKLEPVTGEKELYTINEFLKEIETGFKYEIENS